MANLPDDPIKITKRFASVRPLSACTHEAWTAFSDTLLPTLSMYSDSVAAIFTKKLDYFEKDRVNLRQLLEASPQVNETLKINNKDVTLKDKYVIVLSQILQDKFAGVPEAIRLAQENANRPLYWYSLVRRKCVGSDASERRYLVASLLRLLSASPHQAGDGNKVNASSIATHGQKIKDLLARIHSNREQTDWNIDSVLLETGLLNSHRDLLPYLISKDINISDSYDSLEEAFSDFSDWSKAQHRSRPSANVSTHSPAPRKATSGPSSKPTSIQALAASMPDSQHEDGTVICGFCSRRNHKAQACRMLRALRKMAADDAKKLLGVFPPGSTLIVKGNEYRSSAYTGSVRALSAYGSVATSTTTTTPTPSTPPLSDNHTASVLNGQICSGISAELVAWVPGSCATAEHSDSLVDLVEINCDTAADLHMTSHSEWFSEMHPVEDFELDFGMTPQVAQGVGTIFLEVPGETGDHCIRIKLTNVLYVPTMPSDKSLVAILAASSSDNQAGAIRWDNGRAAVTVDDLEIPLDIRTLAFDNATVRRLILKARVYHNLSSQQQETGYTAADSSSSGRAAVVAMASQVKDLTVTAAQLHRALGHRYTALAAAPHLENISLAKPSKREQQLLCDCEVCKMTKAKAHPHPKRARHPAKAVNDRWSIDNTPMQTVSADGHTNILSMADERSCYIVKAVPTFSREATELVAHIQDAMEASGPPRALRSDNEFSQATSYRKLLHSKRVRLESTAPYSPEQNGSAEQRQTAIVRMIRSWMYESKMPHRFWHYAVDCAVERLNMTLVQKNTGETVQPFAEFHQGKKPVLLYPEAWGALCYVKLRSSQQQEGKLGPNATKAVFLGRAPGTAAALLLLEDGSTTVTTDVVFPKNYQPGGQLFLDGNDDDFYEAEGSGHFRRSPEAQAVAEAEALRAPSDPSWTPPTEEEDSSLNVDEDSYEQAQRDHPSLMTSYPVTTWIVFQFPEDLPPLLRNRNLLDSHTLRPAHSSLLPTLLLLSRDLAEKSERPALSTKQIHRPW